MRISQQFPSNYLSAPDLQGKVVVVAISHIDSEKMADGEFKPILYFQGKEKGLVLNKTNATFLATLFGDETDNWAGQQIELFTIQTEYQGRPVEGLRVRNHIPTPGGVAAQGQRTAAQTIAEQSQAPDPVEHVDQLLEDEVPF